MDALQWKILLKRMIWGYPHFKNPPDQQTTCDWQNAKLGPGAKLADFTQSTLVNGRYIELAFHRFSTETD